MIDANEVEQLRADLARAREENEKWQAFRQKLGVCGNCPSVFPSDKPYIGDRCTNVCEHPFADGYWGAVSGRQAAEEALKKAQERERWCIIHLRRALPYVIKGHESGEASLLAQDITALTGEMNG